MASVGSCILGSRLAIWLLKDANVRVYLHASLETRVQRIAKRDGEGYELSLQKTQERDARDQKRYKRLYQIDVDNYQCAELIVDTGQGDQTYVVRTILDYVTHHKIVSPSRDEKIK